MNKNNENETGRRNNNDNVEDETMSRKTVVSNFRNIGMPPFVLKATSIASLGGILFGYDMGVVSGALPQLQKTFDLTKTQQEMIVSFLYIGACIGSTVGGWICDVAGRKMGVLVTDLFFVCGAAILYWANTFHTVLFGRIVVGFAVAVSGIVDVAYLHEISPLEWRGAIVSVNEACISLGFLVSYLAGYALSLRYPNNGWRTMFGLSAVIAIIQLLGMLFMPESPVWLKEKGRFQEAQESLNRITGGQSYANSEIPIHMDDGGLCEDSGEDILESRLSSRSKGCHEANFQSNNGMKVPCSKGDANYLLLTSSKKNYSLLSMNSDGRNSLSSSFIEGERHGRCCCDIDFSVSQIWLSLAGSIASINAEGDSCLSNISKYYRQSIIAMFLAVMQQFCGQLNVLNYAPEIFSQVGFASEKSSLGSTLLLGVTKFIVTCLVIWKIEHLGRRFLLILGLSIVASSLAILSVAFAGNDGSEPMSTTNQYIAVLGVFGVVIGYSLSFGPLTWLLVSEMFPTSIRGRAIGVSTFISYLCGSLVSYTFLSGQSIFGPSVPFAVYCILTFLSVSFAAVSVPDTGGKTSVEIEERIKTMWWWRKEGNEIEDAAHRHLLL